MSIFNVTLAITILIITITIGVLSLGIHSARVQLSHLRLLCTDDSFRKRGVGKLLLVSWGWSVGVEGSRAEVLGFRVDDD